MSKKNFLINAAFAALGTMMSRITGLLREVLKAYFLGTGWQADAFNLAFLIPNLFRRFTAEGAMLAALVPVMGSAQKEGKDKEFFSNFFWLLTIGLLALTLIYMVGAGWIVRLIAPGFQGEALDATVSLSRLMFPYILFISLAACLQGALNFHNQFFLPAITPVVLNLIIIASSIFLTGPLGDAALAMAIGVLVGGLLQFSMLIPGCLRLGFSLKPIFNLREPFSRKLLKYTIPGLWGTGIYQINIVASTIIASYLGEGAISSLNYSSRLIELVLGVFVVSLSTSLLSTFTKLFTAGELEKSSEVLNEAYGLIIFLCVPVTVILLVFGESFVKLLFERGTFDEKSVSLTASVLGYHALGLLFISVNRVSVSLFNSATKFKLLALIATFSAAVNIGLCLGFSPWLGAGGIALASSLSQLAQAAILFLMIRPKLKIDTFFGRLFLKFMGYSIAAMAFPVVHFYAGIKFPEMWFFLPVVLELMVASVIFLALCWLLRMPEVKLTTDLIIKKLKKS